MPEEVFHIWVAVGVTIAAISFLVIAVVACVLAWLGLKIKAKLEPILESVTPIVNTVKQTAAELKPKVSAISTQAVEVSKLVTAEAHRYAGVSKDVAGKVTDISTLVKEEAHHYAGLGRGFGEKAVDISELVKNEAHRYAAIAQDVADRTKAHIAHADEALDSAVNQVQSASGSVRSAVTRPFREIDGVLTGVSTAILTLARGRKQNVRTATQDEEMFI